jgi:hypothetical protein
MRSSCGAQAGHGEDVLGDLLSAFHVAQQILGHVRPVDHARVHQRLLQAQTGSGDRAAQVVGGLGGEAPLPLQSSLQQLQRVVHDHGQVAELVMVSRDGHTMTEIGRGDQRELIVANTMDGLASARARGRVGGRRPKLTADQAALAQQLYDTRDKTVQQIADLFGVPHSTVYGHLKGDTVPRQPKKTLKGVSHIGMILDSVSSD